MVCAEDVSTGPSARGTDRVGLVIIRSDYAPKFASSNNAENDRIFTKLIINMLGFRPYNIGSYNRILSVNYLMGSIGLRFLFL